MIDKFCVLYGLRCYGEFFIESDRRVVHFDFVLESTGESYDITTTPLDMMDNCRLHLNVLKKVIDRFQLDESIFIKTYGDLSASWKPGPIGVSELYSIKGAVGAGAHDPSGAPGRYSMNIIEATKIALKENRCIAQKSFPYAKMVPNTGSPYTIMGMNGENTMSNWNPTADDILADNWEVVD